MQGVYRLEGQTSSSVVRSHVLHDSTDTCPALIDNLGEKTAKFTTDLIMKQQGSSRTVFNEPSMSKASSFLAITNNLDSLLGDGPVQEKASSPAPVPEPVPATHTAPSSKDEADECIHPTSRFDALRSQVASPKKATAKPKAKSKAKTEPKPTDDKPPAKRAKKTDQESRVRDMNPDSIASSTNKHTSAAMGQQDQAWYASTKDELVSLLDCSAMKSAENDFKADAGAKTKDANSLLGKVRGKKRVVKRRSKENQADFMPLLDEAESVLCTFLVVLKAVTRGAGPSGDELPAKIQSLVSFGAVPGLELMKRIGKHMWSDDLRFMRWDAMVGSTLKFVRDTIDRDDFDPEPLIKQQMNVILQKLLKGIPADKVPWLF